MEETSGATLWNILMVSNFARYINQELGTNIVVDPDGAILEESSFITKTGDEITEAQFKQMAVQYGEGMSKFFEVCADITVDAATSGIANEMAGTGSKITLVIS